MCLRGGACVCRMPAPYDVRTHRRGDTRGARRVDGVAAAHLDGHRSSVPIRGAAGVRDPHTRCAARRVSASWAADAVYDRPLYIRCQRDTRRRHHGTDCGVSTRVPLWQPHAVARRLVHRDQWRSMAPTRFEASIASCAFACVRVCASRRRRMFRRVDSHFLVIGMGRVHHPDACPYLTYINFALKYIKFASIIIALKSIHRISSREEADFVFWQFHEVTGTYIEHDDNEYIGEYRRSE